MADDWTIPCPDLAEALAFFTTRLGFRLDRIRPADDPVLAVLSGHGRRLRLVRLGCDVPALGMPPRPEEVALELARADSPGVAGRAGMRYRDLLPGRRGGRFIASSIAIPEGGPVADAVHAHFLRFQVIGVWRGEVTVVYEGQGPPLRLQAGDWVLQPPGIRHRVLEASPGLEVLELCSPAVHDTRYDHRLTLPGDGLRPGRTWAGQRFVHDRAAQAEWTREGGLERRATAIAEASGGVGAVTLLRGRGELRAATAELDLVVVLGGRAELDGHEALGPGDAVALPPGSTLRLDGEAARLEVDPWR